MPYPRNYQSTTVEGVIRGGLYTDPITSANYLAGPCNYAPVKPCFREDFTTTHIFENKPFNPNEFSLNNFMATLNRISSASNLAALDSAIVLNPVITTEQKEAISADFYQSIANI
jgi:hypothetical protein